ncbi:MAG: PHP domain-containing protein [Candidatus Gastranaerophilales bacterium]|nr:PHP domain-containing protein [Candidatus Gastranaerophilales bacterium]
MIKEDLKKLLCSFSEEDFNGKVDLHIHSCFSDGTMTPNEIAQQAKQKNMKYISISDHNCMDAYLAENIKNNKNIIPAIEFDCFFKGVLIHILGYGINLENEDLKKLFARENAGKNNRIYRLFHLRNPKKVIAAINNSGGIAVLAHPACYWTLFLDSFVKKLTDLGLEGIEVFYPYRGLRGIIKFHSKKSVFKIAQKYKLIKTGGSDSHGVQIL